MTADFIRCGKLQRDADIRLRLQIFERYHGFVVSDFAIIRAIYESTCKWLLPCNLRCSCVNEVISHSWFNGHEVCIIRVQIAFRHRFGGNYEVIAVDDNAARPWADKVSLYVIENIEVEVEMRSIINAWWIVAYRIPVQ